MHSGAWQARRARRRTAHAPNAPLAATGGMNGVGFYKTDMNREREAAQGRGRGPDAELILCSRMDAAKPVEERSRSRADFWQISADFVKL